MPHVLGHVEDEFDLGNPWDWGYGWSAENQAKYREYRSRAGWGDKLLSYDQWLAAGKPFRRGEEQPIKAPGLAGFDPSQMPSPPATPQFDISRLATPAPEDDDGQGEEVIPGVLKQLPDGSYVNVDSLDPVRWETAQQMIRQYNAQFLQELEEDVEGMTPFQQAQVQRWGALDETQRLEAERGLLSEQARLAALGDRGWIERWYAQNPPTARRDRPSLAQAGRSLWAKADPWERRALLNITGRGDIARTEDTWADMEAGTYPLASGQTITPPFTDVPGSVAQELGADTNLREAADPNLREAADPNKPVTIRTWKSDPEKGTETMTEVKKQISQARENRPEQFTTPPTPQFDFLSKVAPGLKGRLGNWQGRTKAPSGQLFRTIDPSEWARFGAMIDWRRGTGTKHASFRDVQENIARRQSTRPPQTPRWGPQRVMGRFV